MLQEKFNKLLDVQYIPLKSLTNSYLRSCFQSSLASQDPASSIPAQFSPIDWSQSVQLCGVIAIMHQVAPQQQLERRWPGDSSSCYLHSICIYIITSFYLISAKLDGRFSNQQQQHCNSAHIKARNTSRCRQRHFAVHRKLSKNERTNELSIVGLAFRYMASVWLVYSILYKLYIYIYIRMYCFEDTLPSGLLELVNHSKYHWRAHKCNQVWSFGEWVVNGLKY